MRKTVWMLVLGLFLAWQGVSQAASTVDSLVQKLVEKGILTEKEATQLKGEIASQEKAYIEEGAKKQVPEWAQNMKISGDLRARVQSERRQSNQLENGDRVRGRIRARLNVETKVNDKAKVIVGIATHDGNGARSNNYTLNSQSSTTPFTKPNVVLNKAYGQYMPTNDWTLSAGKMDNPIWEPMEFLWDSDITPEGAAVQYNHKLNSSLNLFSTGTVFSLGEFNPSTSDPFMYVAQAGVLAKPTEKVDVKAAFMYTGFANTKSGFSGGGANNTTLPANNRPGTVGLKYDYSAYTGAVDVGLNDPFGENFPVYIPRVGAFGEYAMNPSPKQKNAAWMAGAYIGNSKVNGWGTWKATAAYKVLERDAWLDILPDSDFYGGNTDVKGIEGILEIGLAKNLSFSFDYYQTRRLSSIAPKNPERIMQCDLNWKF